MPEVMDTGTPAATGAAATKDPECAMMRFDSMGRKREILLPDKSRKINNNNSITILQSL
jgi:hypothetical protein